MSRLRNCQRYWGLGRNRERIHVCVDCGRSADRGLHLDWCHDRDVGNQLPRYGRKCYYLPGFFNAGDSYNQGWRR